MDDETIGLDAFGGGDEAAHLQYLKWIMDFTVKLVQSEIAAITTAWEPGTRGCNKTAFISTPFLHQIVLLLPSTAVRTVLY